MEFLDSITEILLAWGVLGLIIASFTECFISPVLPDLILIPLALAQPENAVYYASLAVLASVAGGFIGYGIGAKVGEPAARKMIPAKYAGMIQKQAAQNAGWAIFLAALSPLPYKIVCITAGALKVRFDVFILATVIGRSKRFMVEGVLIYYLGDKALALMDTYSSHVMIGFLVFTVLIIAAIFLYRKYKKNRNAALD